VHRLGDVLELLHANIFVSERQLLAQGIVNRLRYADATWFRQSLETCRHVHPIAVDFIAIDDHLAEIDADAKLHLPVLGKIRVLVLECMLDLGRARQCLADSREVGKNRIASVINDDAIMGLNGLGDEIEVGAQPPVGAFLILTGQPTIADDIGIENGGQFVFQLAIGSHRKVPIAPDGVLT
jgi:hypothetical protein